MMGLSRTIGRARGKIFVSLSLSLLLSFKLRAPRFNMIVEKPSPTFHSSSYRTNKPKRIIPSNETKFVFFVGLEGTGHHLIREIVSESPSLKRLTAMGLADAHYNLAKANKQLKLHVPAPGMSPNYTCASSHGTEAYSQFVDRMTSMANATSNLPLTIPVNCIGQGTFASFPFGPRRFPCFRIPNISQFHQACNQVGVTCEMVYLYRDPYSVIRSTTKKRRFNASVKHAIVLYTAILDYLYTTLSKGESTTKLTDCLGILEPNYHVTSDWKSPLADMFGWQNQEHFQVFVNRIYQPPAQMSLESRKRLIPARFDKKMEALVRAHEKVLSLCPNMQSDT